jgi:hypothetical protein
MEGLARLLEPEDCEPFLFIFFAANPCFLFGLATRSDPQAQNYKLQNLYSGHILFKTLTSSFFKQVWRKITTATYSEAEPEAAASSIKELTNSKKANSEGWRPYL